MVNKRMVKAHFTAHAIEANRLARIRHKMSRHISLVSSEEARAGSGSGAARLHLTGRRLPEPIVVKARSGVAVSTRGIEGVCRYTGLDERTYLLICSLVGIARWRVLDSNPLLRPEDLRHPQGVHCVYAQANEVTELAVLLDPPRVCPGCSDFFLWLGAESELLALREVLAGLPARHDFPLDIDPHVNEIAEPQEFDSDF